MLLPLEFQWLDSLEDDGCYTHTISLHRERKLEFDDLSWPICDAEDHERRGAFEILNLDLSHFDQVRNLDEDLEYSGPCHTILKLISHN